MKKLFLALLAVLALSPAALAYDAGLFDQQMSAIGGETIADSLTPAQRGYLEGTSAAPDASLWDSFLRLFRNAWRDAGGALGDTLQSLLKIFLIAVLCGCANSFSQENRQTITMGGALAVAALVLCVVLAGLPALLAAI